MFVLVVFVEMVAKRESALVHTHRAHARRKRIVATVYYIKRKKKAIEKMPIEIFLFFDIAKEEEEEIA